LDHQLDLPESWCAAGQAAAERREKVPIPETVAFQIKPQIAAGLIRQTAALGVVPLDGITADEADGTNGMVLDEVERLELRDVIEVPVTTTVGTVDPAPCVPPSGGRGRIPTRPTRAAVASVAAVTSGLGRAAWQALRVRQGAKGPLAFEFAAVRVWAVRHGAAGPPVWLLVRRSLEPTPEVKYSVSNAEASTPLGVLAEVACTRHEVEDSFAEAKSSLGMAQDETRSWVVSEDY
jgi:SRSO17 transposase